MDLNVCSRRVHDGYATIRSRGRSRPRAVYRSDSEELLKDADGPYALSGVSKIPIVPDQTQALPRWSDVGKDKLLENYGTLRKTPKREAEPRQEVITLNTFASKKWPQQDRLISNGGPIKKDPVANGMEDRVYDSVPLEETFLNPFLSKEKTVEVLPDQELQNGNLYEPTEAFRVVEQRCRIICTPEDDRFSESRGSVKSNVSRSMDTRSQSCEMVDNSEPNGRQPIYAIPNVATLKTDRKNDQRPIVDGNYVPSGDLYRTTAKYIEDINRNIAEIDKSYEELRSNSNNSAYGVINKIAKNPAHRKRDMAPMLPISSHFGDDDRTSLISVDHLPTSPRILKTRPNSYGKLPPKVLPRSSSIDSSCRHSTGSTSTTTESTDSLYAISESLTELTINKALEKRDQRRLHLGYEKMTKEASSSDDEQMNRPLLTGTIRRNRVRVEAVDNFLPSRKERNAFRKNNIQLFRRASERIFDSSRRREGVSLKENRTDDRRYGTLPCRRNKAVRPLHKSSEDVLEGERVPESLQRSCMSTIDVSRHDEAIFNGHTQLDGCLPLYLMDATDIIRKGHLHRTQSRERQEKLLSQEQLQPKRTDSVFSGTLSSKNSRTRHNSLESEEEISASDCQGFATLPRRGNVSKDRLLNDSPRRLSGTIPILEPLYEHAVSHSVRPRKPQSVIPWYELATRKYRHRSCPSLQAHVVSAFEQSLSNMTQRLQQLTATAEKKDTELHELRETIERLRKQSAEATLNNNLRRHTLGDSDSGTTGCTGNSNHQGSSIARQLSADSVTSLNSLSSACSISSHHKKKGWLRSSFSKAFSRTRKHRQGSISDAEDCKEGVGDLSVPNSPRLPMATKHEKVQDQNQTPRSNGQKSPESDNAITGSKSSSALYKQEDEDDDDVDELKKQLREKDMVLTDIRLEALSSAHQLESLKDTVIKMRNEMLNLKQNNERLQRLVTSKSLTSSQSSLPSDPERRFSMTEVASTVAALSNGDHGSTSNQLEDLNIPEQPVVPSATSTTTEPAIEQDTDGKRINVVVYLGSEKSFNFNLSNSTEGNASDPPHCIIASVCISNKTTWDSLDTTVRRCFKDYVSRVDPVTNLGLGVECIAAYHLGEASRCITESQHPELLPCGYMVGHVKSIYLVLSGYSWLAVDTLIPRSIVQRQVNHLMEHRRVILCGPSGTGKSYLAGKLAHALVDADTENKDAAAVATYNVDHKSSKELRQYLTHIAERCDSNAADELPRVIILENLQHAASLSELFSGLLGTRHSTCPAIIGTMSQTTCSTTNLQLHHNFRWVLCANHMEPVKGFLGRYLRRKLLEHELRETGGARNAEMVAVVEWLPRVWLHLNKFLETHSSSDVTIGPRLFLSCPMEVSGSQVWFTDLWNYSVIPYLVEAVREGLALYGRRTSGSGNGDSVWEDPAQFIITSYPWISTHAVHGGSDALLRLRPEDVGYDVVTSGHSSGVGASSVKSLGSTHSDTDGDPLLNMLLRLQEAANFSSPLSNDSDSNSMDSSHTRHSEDLSSSTSSSRGVESAL